MRVSEDGRLIIPEGGMHERLHNSVSTVVERRWTGARHRSEVTTMRTQRSAAPVARLVRLGAALTIVLGIFGMHALAHHGTTQEPAPPMSAGATPSAMTMAAGLAYDSDSHGTAAGNTGEPGRSLGGVVMLCVAMLVAAAASLLGILGLLRRVPRVWAVLCPTVIARVARQVAPRGTGPPSVWQFSVIRC